MSYDDAEARHLAGFDVSEPTRAHKIHEVLDHEWWQFEASPEYLTGRLTSLRRSYSDVYVVSRRPKYGGYRYEFWGVK